MELVMIALFAMVVGIDSARIKAEKQVVELEQQVKECKVKCQVK